jgi:hypothetical protein
MYVPTVVGIDPGLVHTGLVAMRFLQHDRKLQLHHTVIDGPDAQLAADTINALNLGPGVFVFIEHYRPRTNFGTDERMVQANAAFKQATGGTLVKNSGVKKIINTDLMELMHLWSWDSPTHHQDLRSAARIAVLGMLLDPQLNTVVYDYVNDQLEGRVWDVEDL